MTDSELVPDFRVRRSRRARRMRIQLCPWRGAELVLPRGVPESEGYRFLDDRREWIAHAWSRLRRRVPQAFDQSLPKRISLPLTGEDWTVHYEPERSRARLAAPVLMVPAESGPAREALRKCLQARARETLPGRLRAVADRTGLSFRRVQIRDQRTRWGSCSSRGTISLNFRLLFHRPAVVDYLLLHELCHTRHMNHAPRFHALVARHEPDWRALDRELSRAGGGVPGWLGW